MSRKLEYLEWRSRALDTELDQAEEALAKALSRNAALLATIRLLNEEKMGLEWKVASLENENDNLKSSMVESCAEDGYDDAFPGLETVNTN